MRKEKIKKIVRWETEPPKKKKDIGSKKVKMKRKKKIFEIMKEGKKIFWKGMK